jgi:putative lipoprotein
VETCLLMLCLSLGGGGSAPAQQPQDRWFGEDKLKHFVTSFIVTSLASSGARAAGLNGEASLLVGAGTGAGLGVWKEWSDRNAEGRTASVRDMVWDLAGVGTAAIVQAQTQ